MKFKKPLQRRKGGERNKKESNWGLTESLPSSNPVLGKTFHQAVFQWGKHSCSTYNGYVPICSLQKYFPVKQWSEKTPILVQNLSEIL